ncbi:MAG: CvpA family protein [Candidatus Cloacimonadales bacterium]
MSIIDIVLSVVIVVFFSLGFAKGLIKSVVQLLGLIATIYLITTSGHLVQSELINRFGLQPALATIAAYIVIALIIFIMVKLMSWLLESLVGLLQLKFFNRLLGGLFGILYSFFIVALLLVLIEFLPVADTFYEATADSKIINYVRNSKDNIKLEIPDFHKVSELTDKLKEKAAEGASSSKEQMEEFLKEQGNNLDE